MTSAETEQYQHGPGTPDEGDAQSRPMRIAADGSPPARHTAAGEPGDTAAEELVLEAAELGIWDLDLRTDIAEALAERRILADNVEGTDALVQVVGPDFRWLAIDGSAAREFECFLGVLPRVGDDMLDLLKNWPDHLADVRAIWARALGGEEFVKVAAFGDPSRDRRHYEMRFNTLRDKQDGRSAPSSSCTTSRSASTSRLA